MAANHEDCCIHYQHTSFDKNPIIRWSQLQLDNALSKAEEWVLLDKQPENQLAVELLRIRQNSYHKNNNQDDPDGIENDNNSNTTRHTTFYAHKNCYLRFASITKLLAAQKVHNRKKVSVEQFNLVVMNGHDS